MELRKATAKQVAAINAELHRQGLLNRKSEMVDAFTNGRTDHSPEMTIDEARALLSNLYQTKGDMNVSTRLMSKLFAMAHEMGWIPEITVVEGLKLIKKKNYQRVHDWVEKYGYLKKPLREYTYKELPKLVSIFENNIYNTYISNLSNNTGAEKKSSPF